MFPLTAVAAALGNAVSDGVAAVLEQRSSQQVPTRSNPLSLRLVRDLLRRRMWLCAISLNIVAGVLQVVALGHGALALVQPILASNLVFAALAGSAFRRERPDRLIVAGTLCCSGGLALFLVMASPHGGRAHVPAADAAPLLAGTAVALAACLVVARVGPGKLRPIMLALGCGMSYGITAFLLKLLSAGWRGGLAGLAGQWPLYAVLVAGPLGFLFNQSALQASTRHIAPTLSIINSVDPILAIAAGRFFLHESFATPPLESPPELLGLAVMIVGIIALAHRAPQLE